MREVGFWFSVLENRPHTYARYGIYKQFFLVFERDMALDGRKAVRHVTKQLARDPRICFFDLAQQVGSGGKVSPPVPNQVGIVLAKTSS